MEVSMPDNVFDRNLEEFKIKLSKRLHPTDIPPKSISQRHMEANANMIFFGLAANIPDGSTHTKVYFATDTGVLYCWDGSAWLSTTLT